MFDPEADPQTSQFHQLYFFAFNKTREILTAVYSSSGQNLLVFADEAAHYVDSAFLNFDSFQLKILKLFLAILFFNVTLIIFLWNVYKDRIYERFIQPCWYISYYSWNDEFLRTLFKIYFLFSSIYLYHRRTAKECVTVETA